MLNISQSRGPDTATSGGLSIGQIRIQIPQVRGQGVRFRAAGWEGRGIGSIPLLDVLRRRSARRSTNKGQRNSPSRLSPLGKEDRGREREQRSRGKGGCCRTSRTRAAAEQGSVEGGALGERKGGDGSREEEDARGPNRSEEEGLHDFYFFSLLGQADTFINS
jgi:hypothetical protein